MRIVILLILNFTFTLMAENKDLPKVVYNAESRHYNLVFNSRTFGEYEDVLPYNYPWTVATSKNQGRCILDEKGNVVNVKINDVDTKLEKLSRSALETHDGKGSQYSFKHKEKGFLYVNLRLKRVLHFPQYEKIEFFNDNLLYCKKGIRHYDLVSNLGLVLVKDCGGFKRVEGSTNILISVFEGDAFPKYKLFNEFGKPFFADKLEYTEMYHGLSENPDVFCFQVNDKWGVVDTKKGVLVKPIFRKVSMKEKFMTFEIKNEEFKQTHKGLLNYEGKFMFKPRKSVGFSFFGDFCCVGTEKGNEVYTPKGLVLKTDTKVSFYDEYKKVFVGSQAFYNTKGKKLLTLSDKRTKVVPSKGLLLNGKLYNAKGEVVYLMKEERATFYDKGVFMYRFGENAETAYAGFITKSKGYSYVFPMKYQSFSSIDNSGAAQQNLLLVKKDNLWGVFDITTQKLILPFRFSSVTSFGDNLVLTIRDKTCLTDSQGKIIIKPASFSIEQVSGDLALYKHKGKYGVLSSDGTELVPSIINHLDAASLVFSFLKTQKNVKKFSENLNDDSEIIAKIQKSYSTAPVNFKVENDKTIYSIEVNGEKKELGQGEFFFLNKEYFYVGKKLYHVDGTEVCSFYKLTALTADTYSLDSLPNAEKDNGRYSKNGVHNSFLITPTGIIKGYKGFALLDTGKKKFLQYWADLNKVGIMKMDGSILTPPEFESISAKLGSSLLRCKKEGAGYTTIETKNFSIFKSQGETGVAGEKPLPPLTYKPAINSDKYVKPSFIK